MDVKPELKQPRLLGSCRLSVSIMCCLGTFVSIMMSVNLSFALVCMQSSCCTNVTSQITDNETDSIPAEGQLQWNPEIRGVLLGANFYGVVAVQFVIGWLIDKFRNSKMFAIAGIFFQGLATVTTPFVAYAGVPYLIALRILTGMGSGNYFSTLMPILSSWVTPREQGFLVGLAYAGAGMANTLTFPIASFLCKYAGGWPSIFYFTGACGILWAFMALFFIHDSPRKHPRISTEERQFLLAINEHGSLKKKDVDIPWKRILLSVPVWAVIATNFFWFAAYKMTVLYLPIYMRDVLEFTVQENGILSGIPSLCAFVCHLIFGPLFDWLSHKTSYSLTVLRKLFNSTGCFLPAIAMYAVSQLYQEHKYAIIALISAAQGLGEFATTGGYSVTMLNLAPQYVGVLQGLSSTIALTPGFLTPMLIAVLTPTGTRDEWSHVFLLFGSLYAAAGIAFLLFASSERQKWAEPAKSIGTQSKLITDI